MTFSLNAKIADIEIESAYNDVVYEQTVTIKLNGSTYEVFDAHTTVNSDDIGMEIDLELHLIPRSSVHILECEKHGIEPTKDGPSKWAHIIHGSIEKIHAKNHWFENPPESLLVVDVGEGYVIVSTNNEISSMIDRGGINEGDFISVPGMRLEVIGRN